MFALLLQNYQKKINIAKASNNFEEGLALLERYNNLREDTKDIFLTT